MEMKLLLVLVVGVVAKARGDEDELDPFDMVNFDHVGMKMTKVLKEIKEILPAPVRDLFTYPYKVIKSFIIA
jgi:hypothetical protein